jgi:hypothetical protein
MMMRESSVLLKDAFDCCDYIPLTVDEEMGAEQGNETFKGKPK